MPRLYLKLNENARRPRAPRFAINTWDCRFLARMCVNATLTEVVGLVHKARASLILGRERNDTDAVVGQVKPKLYRPIMSRTDLVLALLASASGRAYSPAQLQKSAFLVSTNLPNVVTDGPGFHFEPYDYGPFDRDVYIEAQKLRDRGEAEITPTPWGRWVTYAASQIGIDRGQAILDALPEPTRKYINDVSTWALAQSFNSLVKSIYDAYPQMRVNSIFRDPA